LCCAQSRATHAPSTVPGSARPLAGSARHRCVAARRPAPNTGISENGVITVHSGFIPGGPILSDPQFVNANFLQPGYQIARFQVTAVPEPETYAMLLAGLGLVSYRATRRRKV
jgi:hypothetical protein